ncbi:hypothetical protein JTE90_008544 [Oedothorax gibbosus]|uniref:Gustatory receptor n=1 Tax=Oedothorax gibbosus TaxID=931172 RepID=A0AAV6VGK2_9ARAC|nr:hypothetical protein JTE90_008544 [Oedothorax gibbosus]
MLLYRCFILFKWKSFVKISTILSSIGTNKEHKYNFCVVIWILVYAAIGIPLGISNNKFNSSIGIPYYYYGIPRENNLLYSAVATLHTIYFFFFVQIPIITIYLFYILVCDHLRCIIKNFSARLSSQTNDFESLLRSYGNIKSTVTFIDDQLSLFVFFNVIFTSLTMYYTISSIFQIDLLKFPTENKEVIIHFLHTLTVFIALITAASSVSEASAEVRQRTQILKLDKANAFEQLKFQSCAESEIYLTVWKLVPIRRSFALGTISAIFSYAILVDSLIKK